jgi:hypothetical protein
MVSRGAEEKTERPASLSVFYAAPLYTESGKFSLWIPRNPPDVILRPVPGQT